MAVTKLSEVQFILGSLKLYIDWNASQLLCSTEDYWLVESVITFQSVFFFIKVLAPCSTWMNIFVF